MARVTSAEVQEIIEVDSTISLTPFITVANLMVTKHCVDTTFTADELKEIERWLSAFLYAVRDPRTTSEGAEGVSVSYQKSSSLGLDVNEYGQMAKRLDWSGALAALDNSTKNGLRRSVTLEWLGTENDEIVTEILT
jgi:hypothetical protein